MLRKTSIEYKVSILCQDICKIPFCIWMRSTYFLSPNYLVVFGHKKRRYLLLSRIK